MEFITLALFLLLCILIFAYIYWKMTYFSRHGIPHLKPLPILGNFNLLQPDRFADMAQRVHECDPTAKYVGLYNLMEPVILVRDPELFKSIGIKDFEHFMDHRSLGYVDLDPVFGNNLVNLKGEKWRHFRKILSPAFTPSKLKATFDLMIPCSEKFIKFVDSLPESQKKEVDCRDLYTKFTNDMIALFTFGIEIDSLKNPNNEFYAIGPKATNIRGALGFKFRLMKSVPILLRLFNIRIMSQAINEFFMSVVSDTLKIRREKNIMRADMIQLMMDENLDLVEMAAHAFGFYFGGLETVSNQLCIMTNVLAVHPEIQRLLQQEVDKVLEKRRGEKITFDDIMGMAYMDAVFNETMRHSALALFVDRICTKTYELPPAKPGLKPFVIKPGMPIWIWTNGVHMNPKYFEDPKKFDPQRFMNKKVGTNDELNLAFGVGPRACIGRRFAIMEIKTLIFYILANYNVIRSKKTHDLNNVRTNNLFLVSLEKRKKNN